MQQPLIIVWNNDEWLEVDQNKLIALLVITVALIVITYLLYYRIRNGKSIEQRQQVKIIPNGISELHMYPSINTSSIRVYLVGVQLNWKYGDGHLIPVDMIKDAYIAEFISGYQIHFNTFLLLAFNRNNNEAESIINLYQWRNPPPFPVQLQFCKQIQNELLLQ